MNYRHWMTVSGEVERGHQVASGRGTITPYPDSTIRMQKPFFEALGFDLANYYEATLNISVTPYSVSIREPELTFRQVEWTSLHPPEDFSFSPCKIIFNATTYNSWIYYPHPETKKTHFQNASVLEVLAPFIPDIKYGDRVQLMVNTNEVQLHPATQ